MSYWAHTYCIRQEQSKDLLQFKNWGNLRSKHLLSALMQVASTSTLPDKMQDASGDGEGRISGEDSARCTPPPPPLLRPRISPQSGERPGGATTIESIIRWHDESWPDLSSDLTTRLELRSETWSLLHDDSTDSFACWCRCCSQLSPRQGTFYSFLGLFFLRYSIHRYTMDIRGFRKLDLAFSQIWNHLLNDKISCSCSLPPD